MVLKIITLLGVVGLVWIIFQAIRTGRIGVGYKGVRTGQYSRANDPIGFWGTLAIYSAIVICLLWFGIFHDAIR